MDKSSWRSCSSSEETLSQRCAAAASSDDGCSGVAVVVTVVVVSVSNIPVSEETDLSLLRLLRRSGRWLVGRRILSILVEFIMDCWQILSLLRKIEMSTQTLR